MIINNLTVYGNKREKVYTVNGSMGIQLGENLVVNTPFRGKIECMVINEEGAVSQAYQFEYEPTSKYLIEKMKDIISKEFERNVYDLVLSEIVRQEKLGKVIEV